MLFGFSFKPNESTYRCIEDKVALIALCTMTIKPKEREANRKFKPFYYILSNKAKLTRRGIVTSDDMERA